MRPVPLDRSAQALLQADGRAPPGKLVELGRVGPLAVDLPGRVSLARQPGRDAGARQARDEIDDRANGVRLAAAGVERLATDLVAIEVVGDREIGSGRVLDVEEVALG